MKVLIVSGFLGAGKTTFIKELLNHTDKYVAVLENEIGEVNLDSQDISENAENPDMQVLEFMEGCVCCTRKDSFIYSVLTVSSTVSPDYLIVEPSGVAKLSSIMTNLEKIRYDRIEPVSPVVILAPGSYFVHMREFEDLMKDQIRNCGHVVFSKTDNIDAETLQKVKESVNSLNPKARISDTYSSHMSEEWWNSIMSDESRVVPTTQSGDGDLARKDPFEQVSFQGLHFDTAGLILFLERVLRRQYGDIVRAKGKVEIAGEVVRFDLADDEYILTGDWGETTAGEDDGETKNTLQSVFIGTRIDRDRLLLDLNAFPNIKTKKIKEKQKGKFIDIRPKNLI